MPDGARTDRVSEEIREILAEEVPRLKDPRVGFVTITAVDVTPDLRRAVVYYTVLGEESEQKATRAGLRSARARLRQVIGGQVRLKVVPDLDFRLDDGEQEARRVEELLEKIHKEDADDR
ncbi:MAG TPA: 30S ribosome-binding factor RbfA [Actinomycetota bacterium]